MSRFSIDTDVLDEGINKLSGIQEKLDSLQQRFLMISREIDWEVKGKHALEGNLAQLQAQMKSISISVAIASQSMAQIRDEYINAYNDAKSLADGLPTKVSAGSYSRAEGMLQDPDIPEFVKARIRESIGATKGIKGTGKDNTGSNEGFDYKWTGKAVNDEFKEKVLEISDKLQMDPDDLMAVMAFESGFDPALVHKKTKATGLIQLMPTNAEWLGTSIEELVRFT